MPGCLAFWHTPIHPSAAVVNKLQSLSKMRGCSFALACVFIAAIGLGDGEEEAPKTREEEDEEILSPERICMSDCLEGLVDVERSLQVSQIG